MTGWVKICGLTSVADAEAVAEAGGDAIGLNFVAASPRAVQAPMAREIADAVRSRVAIVGVIAVAANTAAMDLERLIDSVGLDLVQLHGDGASPLTRALAPKAFEARAIGGPDDVEIARAVPGARVLLDARVSGVLGGTGTPFDWSLVVELARERSVILAGGLTPDNVGAAVLAVKPWGVDVASGVELAGDRRRKDSGRVLRFVQAARAAWAALS